MQDDVRDQASRIPPPSASPPCLDRQTARAADRQSPSALPTAHPVCVSPSLIRASPPCSSLPVGWTGQSQPSRGRGTSPPPWSAANTNSQHHHDQQPATHRPVLSASMPESSLTLSRQSHSHLCPHGRTDGQPHFLFRGGATKTPTDRSRPARDAQPTLATLGRSGRRTLSQTRSRPESHTQHQHRQY